MDEYVLETSSNIQIPAKPMEFLGKLQDRNITTVFSLQVTHGTRDTKQNQNVSQSVQQTLVNNFSL